VHSPEIKAKVLAEVVSGRTAYAVAKELGLPPSTVKRWAQIAGAGLNGPLKQEIEDRGVRLLNKYLDTIETGLDAYRDREWWLKQDADKAGIFLGILSDKVFVILGASQRAEQRSLSLSE
jgi:hypothetical protein